MDVRSMVIAWPKDAPRGAVARFCRENEISRSRFYEIRARAESESVLSALQPRAPQRAARHSQAVDVEIEELAVRIRKELAQAGWDHGPLTVRHQIAALGLVAPAASTLARIFTRRGMVVAQPEKRPKTSYRRFEFALVHQCWQLDAFGWELADGSPAAVFQLLDDHSRYLIASHVASGETAAAAMAVVNRGIERFQVPGLLLSDNGVAFNQTRIGKRTALVTMLLALGCRPITGKHGHPQTQGKDERVHATLQRWLRARPGPATLAELQDLIDAFDDTYNHRRAHQSLQMRTPAHALTHDQVAIPPTPPEPDAERPHPITLAHRRACAHGKIQVLPCTIMLGHEYARTQVSVLVTAESLNIFDTNGTHIRTVNLEPGKTYYGNGRRRGRPQRPRSSTLT